MVCVKLGLGDVVFHVKPPSTLLGGRSGDVTPDSGGKSASSSAPTGEMGLVVIAMGD